jgi:hypothetical protein
LHPGIGATENYTLRPIRVIQSRPHLLHQFKNFLTWLKGLILNPSSYLRDSAATKVEGWAAANKSPSGEPLGLKR